MASRQASGWAALRRRIWPPADAGGSAGHVSVIASAIAGTLLAWAISASVLAGFEHFAADKLVSAQATSAELRQDLVVIAIDDTTMAGLPFESPVNRALLASVVDKLDRLGARAIALDFVLDRPTVAEDDARLATVIEAAHARIILGRDPGVAAGAAACRSSRPSMEAGSAQSEALPILPMFAPHAQIADLVLCVDGDGVIRRLATETGPTPGISAALAAELGRQTRDDGRLIRFQLTDAGAPPPPIYSAANLDFLQRSWIEGRAVIIGVVTPLSGDWHETPLRFANVRLPIEPSGAMPPGRLPGVMVHALGAATLVDGVHDVAGGWLSGFLLALAGAVCGAMLAVSPMAWWIRTLAGLGIVAAVLGVSIKLGLSGGPLLPMTPFPLGLALAGGLAAGAEAQRILQQRRMIRGAFERYLSPSVVDELVRNPSLVALGAREREVTVLFTDLENFTRFVDGNPPEVVAQILNGYLDMIIAQVIAAGGAVDKIVGDAVHAIFSAPIDDPDHRLHGCACALAIDDAAEAYRVKIRETTGVQLGMTRIAVHSGKAMVGNFGGTGRLDYTAHGSTINAVARLEAANKVFGTRICVSEASLTPLPDCTSRPIAYVRLRGIAEPIRVHELARPSRISPEAASAFAQAFAAIPADPAEARRRFAALAGAAPSDPLIAFQLRRIDAGAPEAVLDV